MRPLTLTATAILATGLFAGCGTDGATGPGPSTQFSQVLSIPQLDSILDTGARRIEISMVAGGLTIRELDVEPDDLEEKIVSTVTAIDPALGSVTLALGGLTVNYGSNTRFRTPTRSRVSRSEWEAAIGAALAANQHPPIEARRNRPASAQAPTDATFLAADLRIADRTDLPKIEAYVGGANLEVVAAPPPLAILRLFNLPLEITSQTRLGRRTGTTVPSGSAEFQAGVSSVDLNAGTLTLAGGTVIAVGGATFDPTGDLFTLDATASAVAAGKAVRAEGVGTVTSAGPPARIAATDIKVEVDN